MAVWEPERRRRLRRRLRRQPRRELT